MAHHNENHTLVLGVVLVLVMLIMLYVFGVAFITTIMDMGAA